MEILKSFRLDGKVSLVTGAGNGLGLAFAEAMAEAGSDVACVDIDSDAVEQVVQKIRNRGRKAIAITADVSEEEQIKGAVDRTVKELGGVQIAFANAGIAGEAGHILDTTLTGWDKVISINLTDAYLTIREAVRAMKQENYGKIIATASIYGFVGDALVQVVPYTAAKGGVVNLVRMSAVQLAPLGIRVNGIAPAFIKTNIADKVLLSEDEIARTLKEEIIRRTPLGRLGEPDDVKGLGLFLASPASDYLTGTTIPVDGGWLAL